MKGVVHWNRWWRRAGGARKRQRRTKVVQYGQQCGRAATQGGRRRTIVASVTVDLDRRKTLPKVVQDKPKTHGTGTGRRGIPGYTGRRQAQYTSHRSHTLAHKWLEEES